MKLTKNSVELVTSTAFRQLIEEIHPQVLNMQTQVLTAATTGEALDVIRYKAGRLDGALYLLGVFKHAGKTDGE